MGRSAYAVVGGESSTQGMCVELHDYEYDEEMACGDPDRLHQDTRGYSYAGGLQMRLEVLP
jgi:hypothetical protein